MYHFGLAAASTDLSASLQTGSAILINFLVSLAASLMGITLVLFVERQRRPKLLLERGEDWVIGGPADPAERPLSRWLRVKVTMAPMPWWAAWVYQRDPALNCKAQITFHHYPDGNPVMDRILPGRWSESPEPERALLQNSDGTIIGGTVTNAYLAYDLHPNETVHIDVVFRIAGETACHGWTAESYLFADRKHPSWRLERGRYIAVVQVKTAWQQASEAFLIANDVDWNDFRLTPFDQDDKWRLGKKLGLL